ncbi:MAG: hypothetical protein ACRCZP_14660, partial [Phycicoccus sp.]
EDDDVVVEVAPPSGAPVVLTVQTRRHLDVPDLDDALAAAFGRLQVALVGAVESLPSVGRCRTYRIGDGSAHAHWWFLARPLRMPQVFGVVHGRLGRLPATCADGRPRRQRNIRRRPAGGAPRRPATVRARVASPPW